MKWKWKFINGNFKKVKSFATLTVSVYHSLLRKQVVLASMQCKQEDKVFFIEIFWPIFNKAYKEMHGGDKKFFPAGWCTDMASGNFIDLVKMYGEDILETVKGCVFHFRGSVNRKAKLFGELKKKSVTETLSLLTATTPEAYHAARHHFKLFLNNEAPSVDVSNWLDWWHDRRELIFCAFILKVAI